MIKISLSSRVSISLSILLLIMSLLAVSTAVIFYNVNNSVLNVAQHHIPSLTRTFNLVLESERMTSVAPDIIVAHNSYIREALSKEFFEKNKSWESKVASVRQSFPYLPQLQDVADLSRVLHRNIQSISTVIDERMGIEQEMDQITRRIRRLGENLNNTSDSKPSDHQNSKLHEEIVKALNKTIILLLSVPSAEGDYAIDTIEKKYLKSLIYTDQLLSQVENGVFQQFKNVHKELVHFSKNDRDLFILAIERLERSKILGNLLVSNTFVSNQIDRTTDAVLSRVAVNIDDVIQTITNQLIFANIILIILPVMGIVFALCIFFHLKTIVVDRLLRLQKAVRSHIHGDEVSIPVTGNDEITLMAEATRFFISEINNREKALLESHEKLEQRVLDRTREVKTQNNLLLAEIEERITIERALRESEERFRLLAENLKEALCLVELDFGRISFNNRAFMKILELDDLRQPECMPELVDYIHPDDRESIVKKVRQHWGNDSLENENFEFRLSFSDNRIKWIFSQIVYIRDKNGNKIRAALMAENITKRTETAKIVEESERRLKYLSSKLLESQEDERRRLANELHDNIAPVLGAVKFGAENAINLQGNTDQQTEVLQATINMVKKVVHSIGRVQMELRPSIIDDLGVIDTIDWYCLEYMKIYRHISIQKKIHSSESLIPDNLKIVVYRIVQEALNNIAKHSGANEVHLLLESEENILRLKIEDNGNGIPSATLPMVNNPGSNAKTGKLSGGLGLVSLRERVDLTAGTFSLESSDRGTSIFCQWDCTVVEKLSDI